MRVPTAVFQKSKYLRLIILQMKVKRQKKVAKVLSFYSINFGMKAPYNVLVDGTFCKAALEFKVNIREQLPRYLEGEVAFYTTSCALAECESLGKSLPRAWCGHVWKARNFKNTHRLTDHFLTIH